MHRVVIVLIIALVLLSLACDDTQTVFNRIDGMTPTPPVDTCVPDCTELCKQIQAKHGGQPELCAADCEAVCTEAKEAENERD